MSRFIPELKRTLTGRSLAIWDGTAEGFTARDCERFRARWLDEMTPLERIPIHIINLAHRADRREHLTQMIQAAGIPNPIQWVRGVEGDRFHLPRGWDAGYGAYGCHLSHHRLLVDAVMNTQTVWIWEDDVCIEPSTFWANMQRIWREVPPDWQGIYVGGKHFKSALPTPRPGILRCVNTHLTHCYIVRPPLAALLLQAYESTTDHIDKTAHEAQRVMPCYAPTPFLAGQGSSYSDIAEIHYDQDRWWT